MNKEGWKLHYRNERLYSRFEQESFNIGLLNKALHELYDHQFLPEQDAIISLFERYKDKVKKPESYLAKIESWKPAAKERALLVMKGLIFDRNPFLELIKRDNPDIGCYHSTPIHYKENGTKNHEI